MTSRKKADGFRAANSCNSARGKLPALAAVRRLDEVLSDNGFQLLLRHFRDARFIGDQGVLQGAAALAGPVRRHCRDSFSNYLAGIGGILRQDFDDVADLYG